MRRAFLLIGLVPPLALLPTGGGAVAPGPLLLRYQVEHARFGDIGTYTNRIEQEGDVTTVVTEAHFKVRLLGITVHREDAQREERWRGGRLIAFHGVTTTNGKAVALEGAARGDGFVITAPGGATVAPANIHPANPWSANFLDSATMMRVDNGAVEPVRISPRGESEVAIGDAAMPVRAYEVLGKTRYEVWLSEAQLLPVKFSVDDDSGTVTFTLQH